MLFFAPLVPAALVDSASLFVAGAAAAVSVFSRRD